MSRQSHTGSETSNRLSPHSLNDLNLPPNPLNVLATTAVVQPKEECSPPSLEPSEPSPISTPPMNLITIESWKTPHISTNIAIFYSTQRTSPEQHFETFLRTRHLILTNPDQYPLFRSHPSKTLRSDDKRGNWAKGRLFLGRSRVAAQLRGLRPAPTCTKDTIMLRINSNISTLNRTLNYYYHTCS